jgi:hypothetical protein
MTVQRTIVIGKEDDLYLKDHEEINLSGLVRKAIKELREKEEAKR